MATVIMCPALLGVIFIYKRAQAKFEVKEVPPSVQTATLKPKMEGGARIFL